MSAAYLKGVQQQLPQAVIYHDRFHVAALAGKAMDEVRSTEFKARPTAVTQAPGELSQPLAPGAVQASGANTQHLL